MSSRGFGNKYPRKNAREDRLQFMNSQAELIAQKKREIEAKLAEKQVSPPTGGPAGVKPEGTVTEANHPSPCDEEPTQSKQQNTQPSVGFKNDGSFLEMFRKLQQQHGTSANLTPQQAGPIKQERGSRWDSKPEQSSAFTPNLTVRAPETARLPLASVIATTPHVKVEPQIKTEEAWSFCSVQPSSFQPTITVKREERSPSPYSPSRPCDDDEAEQVTVKKETKDPVSGVDDESSSSQGTHTGESMKTEGERKRKSRWGPEGMKQEVAEPTLATDPTMSTVLSRSSLLTRITKADPQILVYATKVFGTTDLTEDQWKQCMDQIKMQYIYQEMLRKKQERERLEAQGKVKYDYDSDEDTEGGTWEHKRRALEMEKTKEWADQLTSQARGRHHIGDFLPPEELAKFMEKYQAMKDGRTTNEGGEYDEFKIAEDNVGYQMLKKFGWTEGQGLGLGGSGITAPINATRRTENQGLGASSALDLSMDDDEYDAYRKRMMLAYRFRPNPLNNPRRSYY